MRKIEKMKCAHPRAWPQKRIFNKCHLLMCLLQMLNFFAQRSGVLVLFSSGKVGLWVLQTHLCYLDAACCLHSDWCPLKQEHSHFRERKKKVWVSWASVGKWALLIRGLSNATGLHVRNLSSLMLSSKETTDGSSMVNIFRLIGSLL